MLLLLLLLGACCDIQRPQQQGGVLAGRCRPVEALCVCEGVGVGVGWCGGGSSTTLSNVELTARTCCHMEAHMPAATSARQRVWRVLLSATLTVPSPGVQAA